MIYPYIAVYVYDKTEFEEYREMLDLRSDIEIDGSYITDDNNLIISLNNSWQGEGYKENIHLLFDKSCEHDLENTNFFTIANISGPYIEYFSSYVIIISYVESLKKEIVKIRYNVFKYLSNKNDTLYLEKANKLKNSMYKNWVTLKRFNTDFKPDYVQTTLWMYKIEKLLTIKNSRRKNHYTTIEELISEWPVKILNDITLTFSDINEIFKQISADDVTRSNIMIQRRIIWLAIFSIISTFYGANKDACNERIMKFFHYMLNYITIAFES